MRLRSLLYSAAAVLSSILTLSANESAPALTGTNAVPSLQTTLRNEEIVRSEPVRRAYVNVGTNVFAFVVPDGYRLDGSSSQRVSLVSFDNHCFLTFQVADTGSISTQKPDPEVCREQALALYPNAKVLAEFSKTVSSHRGPAFDLQWTNSYGGSQAARVIFIPSEAGILKFTARSSQEEFEEAAGALHQLSLSFRSNEDGALHISPLSDKI